VATEDKQAEESLWREYEHAARLEQELVRNRWTFFTALLSVSFVVGGLTLNQMSALGPLLGKAGFAFGWLIFIAAFYHYWWFHGKSHEIRERLCELEAKLDIEVYLIRTKRPRLGPMKLYYHWAIDALAVAYTLLLVCVLAS
jgi:hypothetical protein